MASVHKPLCEHVLLFHSWTDSSLLEHDLDAIGKGFVVVVDQQTDGG